LERTLHEYRRAARVAIVDHSALSASVPALLRVLPRRWCRRHHPRQRTFDRMKAVT
jgi:hypothetical protein